VGGHVAAVAIPAGSTGHHRRADKGEVAETGASKANPTQTDDGPNTAIGELTGGTLRISQ